MSNKENYKKGDMVLLRNGLEAEIIEYDENRRYAEVSPLHVPNNLQTPAFVKIGDIIKKLK